MNLILQHENEAGIGATPGALLRYCFNCELNTIIPADLEAMEEVTAGVSELLTSKQWPRTDVMKVDLAVREALANAIRHGCGNDPGKQVQCGITLDAGGEVSIVVRDPGPGFDPAKVPDPLEAGNMSSGSGRGVFLINELMDSVEFTDGGRQVLMRKRPGK